MANCNKTLWLWVVLLFSTPLAAQLFNAEKEAKGDKLSSYFFSIDVDQLKRTLINSGTQSDRSTDEWIRISLPDHLGNYKEYLIAEDPAALPDIYNAYPGNKTFKLIGFQDEHIHGVLSYSDKGFEGMILDHNAVVYIEPIAGNLHKSYVRSTEEMKSFYCNSIESETGIRLPEINARKRGNDNNIRTYRLAVAAAVEFCDARSDNLTTINADLNYYVSVLNLFYEYELGIKFTRVTGNELVFTSTDNINPGDPITVHSQIASVVPTSNFDIGHGFGHISSGGSGIAYIGVVCSNTTKGRGWSSASNNASMIDIVLHEVGHQFGARHSFYGNNGNCSGGNRSDGFGYEPGSGNSLMSYEGNCPNPFGTATCPTTHNITPYVGT